MNDYELVDFGDGRKLERFGTRLVDRPSPAAESVPRQHRRAWCDAQSTFDGQTRRWTHREPWPEPIIVDCGGFVMPVSPTPFGHVGLFPEQANNWRWLIDTAPARFPPVQSSVCDAEAGAEALNLFAYTGGSTMAMVASGMRVTHVDAAKPNVQAAGVSARRNGWTQPPIRFLVDDAAKFVAREVRRGHRYQTIVLDPPSYGHGPSGSAWRLERDLWPLLKNCIELLDRRYFRLLITGHSPTVDQQAIASFLRRDAGLNPNSLERQKKQPSIATGRLGLNDASGRLLDAGFSVRVSVVP